MFTFTSARFTLRQLTAAPTEVISRSATAECGGSPDVSTSVAPLFAWINAVRTGQIDSTLPLTAKQGGPIPHPSIKFTTTEKTQLPNQASVR